MRRSKLRRRYGHGQLHGPHIAWQGTDYIERQYSAVQPSLASAALGEQWPGREAAMHKGEALLTWMLSMNTKGAGARGKRFLEQKIASVRHLLHRAEGR